MSNSKRKRKQRAKRKAMEKNASVTTNNIDENSKVPSERIDCMAGNCDSGKNLADTDFSGQTLEECPTMATGSTENLPDLSENGRKRTRWGRNKREEAKRKCEAQALSANQAKMDTESTKYFIEGKVHEEQKNGENNIKMMAESKAEAQCMDQADEMSNLHLSEGNHGRVIDGKPTENEFMAQHSKGSIENESPLSNLVDDTKISINLFTKEEAVLLQDAVEVSCGGVSSGSLEETPGDTLRPIEVDKKSFPCGVQHSSNPNHMDVETLMFESGITEASNGIAVSNEKCLAEGGSVLSTCDVELKGHNSFPVLMDFGQYPWIAPVYSSKRKLLVLDVNGLLANIVFPAPKNCRGDTHILGRAVFKRPFCDDFLRFCFQNFDVGIWSSRSKKLIDRVVEYLLGDLQDRLLFCWDMLHSTQTGFKTLENCHKPLVFKELRKIWESDGPNLRWRKGQYNESNTLLLDDSPYKALLNPLHTAVFPESFNYEDKSDNSLGPGGDLRVYLEGLSASENVHQYVEQHPFGQSAINESSLSWEFYSRVLQTTSTQVENNDPRNLPTLSWQ